MYTISTLSGKLFKNGIDCSNDPSMMTEYQSWLNQDNQPDYFEGTDQEKDQYLNPALLEKLKGIVVELRQKALSLAIDKEGDPSYVRAQRELYEEKYRLACLDTLPAEMVSSWEDEAAEFGVNLDQFKAIVKQRGEASNAYFYPAIMRIERARTKMQTLLEVGNRESFTTAKDMVWGILDPNNGPAILSTIINL